MKAILYINCFVLSFICIYLIIQIKIRILLLQIVPERRRFGKVDAHVTVRSRNALAVGRAATVAVQAEDHSPPLRPELPRAHYRRLQTGRLKSVFPSPGEPDENRVWYIRNGFSI